MRASLNGELVAHLCPDCDVQLPEDWVPGKFPALRLRPLLA
ncbi:hypothetical protein AB0A05_27415 [Streptomyces sp. NPDC046374]